MIVKQKREINYKMNSVYIYMIVEVIEENEII